MGADGAYGIHSAGGAGGGARDERRAPRDPLSLASTRLTRELIAADARSDQAREDASSRAARLLASVLAGLRAPLGAIVRQASGEGAGDRVVAQGVAPSILELLAADVDDVESLVRRACEQRRVFLLDRASREPLMAALRAESPEVVAVAIVPLYDRGSPAAVLIVGVALPDSVRPAAVRLLAPAFHLLGVLLSEGRGQPAGGPGESALATCGEAERYALEIEELRSLLREAREGARVAAERASAAEAAQRAELESQRARIAELVASASHEDLEVTLRRELEEAYTAQARGLAERDGRIAELEDEVQRLEARLERACTEELDEPIGANVTAVDLAGAEDDGSAVDQPLSEIAAAAAAALEDGGSAPAVPPESGDLDGGVEPIAEDVGEDAAPLALLAEDAIEVLAPAEEPTVLVHIEGDGAILEAAREAALNAGALIWSSETSLPGIKGSVVVANLLAPDLGRLAELEAAAGDRSPSFAYAHDAADGSGFELGRVGWVARPLEPERVLECMRSEAGGRLAGVMIISAQLRELGALRERLSRAGVSASVACDVRQALELLEIVRKPDALLVDLALEGGQGLALAAQLRAHVDTRDLPLLLLLPVALGPERLADAVRQAGVLGPYGADEVVRLVSTALAAQR